MRYKCVTNFENIGVLKNFFRKSETFDAKNYMLSASIVGANFVRQRAFTERPYKKSGER
jgi:hypothetical protein